MSDEQPKLNLVVTRNGVPCADQKKALEEFKEACRRSGRKPLTPSQMWDNIMDACMADIMALSDEEILKEAAEDGDNIEDITARAKERIRKAMAEADRRAALRRVGRCAKCGGPIGMPEGLCGECSCEDDCAPD